MGLLARLKALWYSLFNKSVRDLEERQAIAIAEGKLNQAAERLKDARGGLINYQAMVLKVQQQVHTQRERIESLTGQIKTHLKAGQERLAGQLALELAQLKTDLTSNEEQLGLHQENYENNLLRMKAALKEIQSHEKELEKKKADLQLERALAEVSETAGALNSDFGASSDIGHVLSRVDDQIHQARARSRVAADLAGSDIDLLRAKRAAERVAAQELLAQFKAEEGLAEPSTTPVEKALGPEETKPKAETESETS